MEDGAVAISAIDDSNPYVCVMAYVANGSHGATQRGTKTMGIET